MRSYISTGVFGLAMVFGSVAMADPANDTTAQPAAPAATAQTSAPAAATPASDSDANMVICRERQGATGSRLGASRECHTKHQWDEMQQQNQHMVIQQQQSGLNMNPSGH
jgi:zona occludens toxin (predicted ATPase)